MTVADIRFDYAQTPKLVEVRDLCKWFPVKRTIADSLARRLEVSLDAGSTEWSYAHSLRITIE